MQWDHVASCQGNILYIFDFVNAVFCATAGTENVYMIRAMRKTHLFVYR